MKDRTNVPLMIPDREHYVYLFTVQHQDAFFSTTSYFLLRVEGSTGAQSRRSRENETLEDTLLTEASQ